MERNHSVQLGDIFVEYHYMDGDYSYSFYQVVKLRGKTQVALACIGSAYVLDELCERNKECLQVPVPMKEIPPDAELIVRKVRDGSDGKPWIWLNPGWDGSISLYDKKQRYEVSGNGIGILVQRVWEKAEGQPGVGVSMEGSKLIPF